MRNFSSGTIFPGMGYLKNLRLRLAVDGEPDLLSLVAQIAEQFPQEPPDSHTHIAKNVLRVLTGQSRNVSFTLKDGTEFAYDTANDTRLNRARYELNRLALHESVLKLGRVNESAVHKLVEVIQSRRLIWASLGEEKQMGIPAMREWDFAGYKSFLIQHDWAAAFANATDYEGGEYRLPADFCIFEGRVNGRRFIADMSELDGVINCFPFVETTEGWALIGTYDWIGGVLRSHDWYVPDNPISDKKLIGFIGAQVRAICIGLEAEVAATEVIRAPHKLNRAREKAGKKPIFDHHVVKLANRQRLTQAEPDPDREIVRKRMHFVRGHWRHYQNSKTWIKWHLRGDPELGFIDKEYRL